MLQKLLSLRFRKKSVDSQDDLTRKERKDIEKQKLVKSDEENVEDFDDISFIVDYIGSDYVSEAQSVPLLMETLKRIKKQHTKTIRVDLVLRKGILKVTDNEQGALLITAPLYAIALCAQEQLRGFETVFALNITRRRIHLCHVFEGGSRLEAASIVRSIAISFRSVAKDLKEKRHETFTSSLEQRNRNDSDMSPCAREFDDIARRHSRTPLPTLQSEEDLSEFKDEVKSCQVVPVQIHNFRSLSQSTDGDEINSVNNASLQKEGSAEIKRALLNCNDENFKRGLSAMQSQNLSSFHRCIEEGNLTVDAFDNNHASLLHHAVIKNQPRIVRYLLERGADVNIEGPKDQTPLHSAAAEGNRAITKILLEFGANVRAKDCQFRTPLHYCAGCLQSLEVSYVLVEHGARIEDNDIEGVRPVDLHLELREMQNRLIQSACEAFGSADLSRSRSSSGCSTHSNSSFRSMTRSPAISKRLHKVFRTGSFRMMKVSPSLQSIQDLDDETSITYPLPPISSRPGFRPIEKNHSHFRSNSASYSGYSSDVSKTTHDASANDVISVTTQDALSVTTQDVLRVTTQDALSATTQDALNATTQDALNATTQDALSVTTQDALSATTQDVLSVPTQDALNATTQDALSLADQVVPSDYSTSAREETTDSEFEQPKDVDFFSEDYLYTSETDDEAFKKNFHYKSSQTSSSSKMFKKDPASDALHLLVTLSINAECQSSILANICLPKFSNQLVHLAHGTNTDNDTLHFISKLLQNLFSVAGPTGRQKCISTGLLKTVIDLLDAAEPIQSTCLSILNDLLQTDGDRDYSGTISGIPVEPLLAIIQSIDQPEVSSPIEKLRMRNSKSCDSGYSNSPSPTKKCSFHEEQEGGEIHQLKYHSLGRTKASNSNYLSLIINDNHNRVRSDSANSAVDNILSRESASLSLGRGSVSRNSSDAESREFHSVRRISRDSCISVDTNSRTSSTLVARHVAMKMLATSSRNAKLQEELAKPRILKLLLECLDDSDEQIVLEATTTLANISMNVETHSQCLLENIEEGLFNLLNHPNSFIKYQAARGLVYLGHVTVEGVYLFDFLPNDVTPTVTKEESGRTFIRGTSVENLIYTLTDDIHLLWGGASITPPSPNDKKLKSRHSHFKVRSKSLLPSESQIINFILLTYQTFVHPVIFMRLLLHRFRHPIAYKIFSQVVDGDVVVMEHYAPLPILHARLMRVWIAWLEIAPRDFVDHPSLAIELETLINPMKIIEGPYAPCATRLEQLLGRLNNKTILQPPNLYGVESGKQHNILYEKCYKVIKDGQLPCSDDDFVFLAGLQVYIEDLCTYGSDFTERLSTIDSINSSRLKQSIGPSVLSKNFTKKIRAQYEIIFQEQPTERNAKHRYVDCCQCMVGYGCRFFKVKQRIPTNRARKKTYITRLFGVNTRRIVVLDERTKVCVEKFNSRDLRRWIPVEDCLTLKTIFITKTAEKTLEFTLENRIAFKEISNYILTSTMELNYQGYHNIDTNPWSKLAEDCGTWGSMALQMHVDKSKVDREESSTLRMRSTTATAYSKLSSSCVNSGVNFSNDYSQSAPAKPGISWNASEALSFLNLKGKLRSRGDTITSTTTEEINVDKNIKTPLCSQRNETIASERPLLAKSPALSLIPEKGSTMEENPDCSPVDYLRSNNIGKMMTCNCPPDAYLPDINLREFSAFELLQHPSELARQITLIDHEMFCSISSKDILQKISLGLVRKYQKQSESQMTVEKLANRFNQMVNWIASSIVSERNIRRRAMIFKNFIETAKQCLELRNYNAVMAIVVAALGSAPVRRLAGTKELLSPECLSSFQRMENLMDSKKNHQRYRENLRTSQTPTVPYFGIYLKDLTFISDGNPDYLKGGVVNLSKRRQVYVLLEEIHRFQRKRYNFQQVVEIKDYLLNKPLVFEEKLHEMSKENEPNIPSRFGTAKPPLTHYQPERRGSLLYTTASKTLSRRSSRASSATQV